MQAIAIEKAALCLPVDSRADLAHKLIMSLDTGMPMENAAQNKTEIEVMRHWLNEASQRARDIDEGHVELIPSDIVNAKARALLL